jgi:hypothetical protein
LGTMERSSKDPKAHCAVSQRPRASFLYSNYDGGGRRVGLELRRIHVGLKQPHVPVLKIMLQLLVLFRS